MSQVKRDYEAFLEAKKLGDLDRRSDEFHDIACTLHDAFDRALQKHGYDYHVGEYADTIRSVSIAATEELVDRIGELEARA